MSSALYPASKSVANRRVLSIAVPAIIANSSAPLVGLVDTWAVGHLPGVVHLAAVGLGSVIFSYIFWAFGFLRMGTTGLVAQAWGRSDTREMQRVVLRSCALALFIGVLLLLSSQFLLSASLHLLAAPEDVATVTSGYFEIRIWASPATLFVYAISGVLFGLGRTRGVLVLQLVLNLANAALNLFFVVGLDMGVAGVALGTLIAQWLAAGLAAWMLFRLPGMDGLWSRIRDATTWRPDRFRPLVVLNGFIFVRTVFLMTALTLIMREAALLGDVAMAASHVANQYLLLISLGLDGFAHAAEALAGGAWGLGQRKPFQQWVRLTSLWALGASAVYALVFWSAGSAITATLTDIDAVRQATATVLPLIVAMPLVSVWCYQFDGVFIGATAARAMMVTMGLAFLVYLLVLGPMTRQWGLPGLWGAVMLFMACRGLLQAAWYPRLLLQLK